MCKRPQRIVGGRHATARRVRRGAVARRAAISCLSCAVALLLGGTTAALAADGGPSLNIPVPATARVGGATAPTTTAAGASGATGPGRTAAPAGGTTVVPAGTVRLPPATAPPTGAATGPASPSATTAPQSAAAAHPTPARAKRRSSGTSTTAIVLAALAAVLVLACAAWAIVRARGVEPHWTLSLRHAMAEASHRASATWAELGDWARLGR